jgi:tRNA A37 threonylcarbamoyladenosine biosynthesis protein TsaE
VVDPHNFILIEWPEQVGRGVPYWAIEVALEQVGEEVRNIEVTGIEIYGI